MIDNLAQIHPSAKIGKEVSIGPWSVIGADVEIGDNCRIGPHVVIQGPTRIGKNNTIFQFSSIGDAPQDKKYDAEPTTLEIGDNNTIREFVSINRGTVHGGGKTVIGNENWIMAYAHIAHDCIVGNYNIFSNNASLAGHVIVGDYVTISGFAGVHQFCQIGDHAFVGKASYIAKDVLPYITVAGHSPEAHGLNSVGLKRRGFTDATLLMLRRAYKIIFRDGNTVQEAVAQLEVMLRECPEVQLLIDAMQSATRGIVR